MTLCETRRQFFLGEILCVGGGRDRRAIPSGSWAFSRLGGSFPFGPSPSTLRALFLGALMHFARELRPRLPGVAGGARDRSDGRFHDVLDLQLRDARIPSGGGVGLGVANAGITVIGCLIARLGLARVIVAGTGGNECEFSTASSFWFGLFIGGVRQVAAPAASRPLSLNGFEGKGSRAPRRSGHRGVRARSVLHTAHLLRLSEDLPVVIEIVDSSEHVERLLFLDEMVGEGLVTMEKVRVVKYAPGTRPLAMARAARRRLAGRGYHFAQLA